MELRKKLRLKGYDYSQPGCYFVTICVRNRERILWNTAGTANMHDPVGADIIRPKFRGAEDLPLSEIGQIVERAIQNIPNIYEGVTVEKHVVMPNHVHLILKIDQGRMISAPTISAIVGSMKRWASRQCGKALWQKGFYDHIIRDEQDFHTKWTYIDTNPAKWTEDCYYREV